MGQISHLKFRFESIKDKKILLFRVVDEMIIEILLFQNAPLVVAILMIFSEFIHVIFWNTLESNLLNTALAKI